MLKYFKFYVLYELLVRDCIDLEVRSGIDHHHHLDILDVRLAALEHVLAGVGPALVQVLHDLSLDGTVLQLGNQQSTLPRSLLSLLKQDYYVIKKEKSRDKSFPNERLECEWKRVAD